MKLTSKQNVRIGVNFRKTGHERLEISVPTTEAPV